MGALARERERHAVAAQGQHLERGDLARPRELLDALDALVVQLAHVADADHARQHVDEDELLLGAHVLDAAGDHLPDVHLVGETLPQARQQSGDREVPGAVIEAPHGPGLDGGARRDRSREQVQGQVGVLDEPTAIRGLHLDLHAVDGGYRDRLGRQLRGRCRRRCWPGDGGGRLRTDPLTHVDHQPPRRSASSSE